MDILALVPAGEYNSPGLDTVGRSPEDGTLTRFSEVSDFLSRLRQCICKPAVLILFVDGPARLRSLGQAGDLLSGFHIVIVLQTMDKESVALAHRLQPRVVIAREQADEELAGIVERMIGIRPALRTGTHSQGKGDIWDQHIERVKNHGDVDSRAQARDARLHAGCDQYAGHGTRVQLRIRQRGEKGPAAGRELGIHGTD